MDLGVRQSYRIIEVREESPQVKSFFFKFNKLSEPGQFLMVRVPGVDEVPMSISYFNGSMVGISVSRVGETTKALHKLKVGDYIGLRGPFGKSFKLMGKNVVLVSGGCGTSPLVYLAEVLNKKGIKVSSLIGAGCKKELLFMDRLGKVSKVTCSTDDGSHGHRGFVTDLLEKELKKGNIDHIYACGPEIMIKKSFEICEKNKVDMQASLERYMKCGMGICGSCMINEYRVCRDGPVFDSKVLRKMEEFGKYKRDSSGGRIKV